MSQTSMLHVRVDDALKADAMQTLAGVGLTVSDAVRILLARGSWKAACRPAWPPIPQAYDAWFRAKAREAIADTRPTAPHRQVMGDAQALIDRKRRARV